MMRSLDSLSHTGSTKTCILRRTFHVRSDLSRAVMRCLHTVGMSYMQYTQGFYIDGHERPDVVSYRDAFLERMSNDERYFFKYEGEDMATIFYPALNFGERPRVLVKHDESCFSSHDGKTTIWMDESNRPLRPKGQGRSIMVSECLCEFHGAMKLNQKQR